MRKRKIKPITMMYNLLLRAVRDCKLGDPQIANELFRRAALPEPPPPPTNQQIEEQLLQMEMERDKMMKIKPLSHEDIPAEYITDNETELSNNDKIGFTPDSGRDSLESGETGVSGVDYTAEEQKLTQKWLVSQQTSGHGGIRPSEVAVMDQKRSRPLVTGTTVLDMAVPNILNPRGRVDGVIGLGDLEKPWQRLALLGGVPGILSHMMKDEAQVTGLL